MEIVVSAYARFEMARRHIDETVILRVAENPQQVVSAGKGRLVYQSRYYDAVEEKEMLLRLILEKTAASLCVVTVYKTSKVDKYWRRG